MRFFTKGTPRMLLTIADGATVKFDSVDGQVGIFATDNPGILASFDRMIAEHRGGLDEITAEQYQDLKKKGQSSSGSRTPWREEIANASPQSHPFKIPVTMDPALDAQVDKLVVGPAAPEKVDGVLQVMPPNMRPKASK